MRPPPLLLRRRSLAQVQKGGNREEHLQPISAAACSPHTSHLTPQEQKDDSLVNFSGQPLSLTFWWKRDLCHFFVFGDAAARSLSFVLVHIDDNPDTNFHQSQNRPFDLTRSFIFGGTILWFWWKFAFLFILKSSQIYLPNRWQHQRNISIGLNKPTNGWLLGLALRSRFSLSSISKR